MVTQTRPSTPVGVTHPLDPLTPDEIAAASRIASAHEPRDGWRFPLVALDEPAKDVVQSFADDDAIARRAFLMLLDVTSGDAAECVVDLDSESVVRWTNLVGHQPFPLMEEFGRATEAVRNDSRWLAAMKSRGYTDEQIELIQIDPWPGGNFGTKWENEHRTLKAISYLRDSEESNAYGRPIEHVMAVVDLVESRVLDVIDEPGPPSPDESLDYRYNDLAPREDLKALDIVQPDGVSFTLDGHLLSWQKWQMRVSLHPREGLVLHQIAYNDDGELRPICYRASMAEMVVPYGDPSPTQYFKNAFDSGEVGGLGRLTNSLELGCDCLGEIVYMDGHVTNEFGGSRTIKNAICIHEEDFGISWKHTRTEGDVPVSEVRRTRRLVVSAIATVGNYDYGFYWMFYPDGSWEQEIKATGIVQTISADPDDPQITRHMIAPGLAAPIHQHFFCFRMDMEIDGGSNTVYEVDTAPLPAGPDNPYGNAFTAIANPLLSEADGQRVANSASARHWRIANSNKVNHVGHPPAYVLIPGETVAMMASPESAVYGRAGFTQKQLWVTPYDASQMYPAGDYPNQSVAGEGIPSWVAADRAIADEDLVLWYTVGMNHIVVPEDWPVAPVHRSGFTLRPSGFFAHNPALDLPAPDHCAHDMEHDDHDHANHTGHASHNGHS